ncbi:MAG TPA: hypothetical protein VGU61_04980 [Noviherbaspirillum sp.]|jgi:hypothetical protein|nr:hypothetical protein [Noviherbaspirillum sp.]
MNETSTPGSCLKFFALIFLEVILIKTWLFPSCFKFPLRSHSARILTLMKSGFANDMQHHSIRRGTLGVLESVEQAHSLASQCSGGMLKRRSGTSIRKPQSETISNSHHSILVSGRYLDEERQAMRYVLAAGSSRYESIRRREDGSPVFTDIASNDRRNGEFSDIHHYKRKLLGRISSSALHHLSATDDFRNPAPTDAFDEQKRLPQASRQSESTLEPLPGEAGLGLNIGRKPLQRRRGHPAFRIGLGEDTRFTPVSRVAPD